MRSTPISSLDDLIDTREIAARIDWLTCDHTDDDGQILPQAAWGDDQAEYGEYVMLRDLMQTVADSVPNGWDPADDLITLVRESHWRDHTIEWFADTWDADWFEHDPRTFKERRLTWDDITSVSPFNCIDWDLVARDRLTECSQVEFAGISYVINL